MKKFLAILMVMVMAVALFAGCGGDTAGEKTVAVVAKGESHAFWQSVKAGADTSI